MHKRTLKNKIFDFLTPLLKEKGFKAQKSKDRFVRKTAFGFQGISYHLVALGDELTLTFYFLIRFDEVENLWHQVSLTNPKKQPDTATLIVEQRHVDGIVINAYTIKDEQASDQALLYFFENNLVAGERLFQNMATLEQVTALWNKSPNAPINFMKNLEKRAIKGVILAFLTNHHNRIIPYFQIFLHTYHQR